MNICKLTLIKTKQGKVNAIGVYLAKFELSWPTRYILSFVCVCVSFVIVVDLKLSVLWVS